MDKFYCRACHEEGDLISCDACGDGYRGARAAAAVSAPAPSVSYHATHIAPAQQSALTLAAAEDGAGTSASGAAQLPPPPQPLLVHARCMAASEECPGRQADWYCPACRCVFCGEGCYLVTSVPAYANTWHALGAAVPTVPLLSGASGNGSGRPVGRSAALAAGPAAVPATEQRRGDVAQLAVWRMMTSRVAAEQVGEGRWEGRLDQGRTTHGAPAPALAAAPAPAAPWPLLEQCQRHAASADSPLELEQRLDVEVLPNPRRDPELNWPLRELLQRVLQTPKVAWTQQQQQQPDRNELEVEPPLEPQAKRSRVAGPDDDRMAAAGAAGAAPFVAPPSFTQLLCGGDDDDGGGDPPGGPSPYSIFGVLQVNSPPQQQQQPQPQRECDRSRPTGGAAATAAAAVVSTASTIPGQSQMFPWTSTGGPGGGPGGGGGCSDPFTRLPCAPGPSVNPAAVFVPAFAAALVAAVNTNGGGGGGPPSALPPGQIVALTAFLHRRTMQLKQQIMQIEQLQRQQQLQEVPYCGNFARQASSSMAVGNFSGDGTAAALSAAGAVSPDVEAIGDAAQHVQSGAPGRPDIAAGVAAALPAAPPASGPGPPPPPQPAAAAAAAAPEPRLGLAQAPATCVRESMPPAAERDSALQAEAAAAAAAAAAAPPDAAATAPKPARPRLSAVERLELMRQRRAQAAAAAGATTAAAAAQGRGHRGGLPSGRAARQATAVHREQSGESRLAALRLDGVLGRLGWRAALFLIWGWCSRALGCGPLPITSPPSWLQADGAPLGAAAVKRGSGPAVDVDVRPEDREAGAAAVTAGAAAAAQQEPTSAPPQRNLELRPDAAAATAVAAAAQAPFGPPASSSQPSELPPVAQLLLPESLLPEGGDDGDAGGGAAVECAQAAASSVDAVAVPIAAADVAVPDAAASRHPQLPPARQPPPPPPPQQQLQINAPTAEVLSALALLQSLPSPPTPPTAPGAAVVAARVVAAAAAESKELVAPTASAGAIPMATASVADATDEMEHCNTISYNCAVRCICCGRLCHVSCLTAYLGGMDRGRHQLGLDELASVQDRQQQLLLPGTPAPWLLANDPYAAASAAAGTGPSRSAAAATTTAAAANGGGGDPGTLLLACVGGAAGKVLPGGEPKPLSSDGQPTGPVLERPMGHQPGAEFVCSAECDAVLRCLRWLREKGCMQVECNPAALGLAAEASLEWQLVELWPPLPPPPAAGAAAAANALSRGGNAGGGDADGVCGIEARAGEKDDSQEPQQQPYIDVDGLLKDLEACLDAPAAVGGGGGGGGALVGLDPSWRTAGGRLGGLSWGPVPDSIRCSGGGGSGGDGRSGDGAFKDAAIGSDGGESGGGGGAAGGSAAGGVGLAVRHEIERGGVQLAALLWVDEQISGVVLVHVYGAGVAVVHVPAVHPRFAARSPGLAVQLLRVLEDALSCVGVRNILLSLTPAAAYDMVTYKPDLLYKRRGRHPRLTAAEAAARAGASVAAAAAMWLDSLGYMPAEASLLAAKEMSSYRLDLPPPSALLAAEDPRCPPPGPYCAQPVGRVLYCKHLRRPIGGAAAAEQLAAAAAAAATAAAAASTFLLRRGSGSAGASLEIIISENADGSSAGGAGRRHLGSVIEYPVSEGLQGQGEGQGRGRSRGGGRGRGRSRGRGHGQGRSRGRGRGPGKSRVPAKVPAGELGEGLMGLWERLSSDGAAADLADGSGGGDGGDGIPQAASDCGGGGGSESAATPPDATDVTAVSLMAVAAATGAELVAGATGIDAAAHGGDMAPDECREEVLHAVPSLVEPGGAGGPQPFFATPMTPYTAVQPGPTERSSAVPATFSPFICPAVDADLYCQEVAEAAARRYPPPQLLLSSADASRNPYLPPVPYPPLRLVIDEVAADAVVGPIRTDIKVQRGAAAAAGAAVAAIAAVHSGAAAAAEASCGSGSVDADLYCQEVAEAAARRYPPPQLLLSSADASRNPYLPPVPYPPLRLGSQCWAVGGSGAWAVAVLGGGASTVAAEEAVAAAAAEGAAATAWEVIDEVAADAVVGPIRTDIKVQRGAAAAAGAAVAAIAAVHSGAAAAAEASCGSGSGAIREGDVHVAADAGGQLLPGVMYDDHVADIPTVNDDAVPADAAALDAATAVDPAAMAGGLTDGERPRKRARGPPTAGVVEAGGSGGGGGGATDVRCSAQESPKGTMPVDHRLASPRSGNVSQRPSDHGNAAAVPVAVAASAAPPPPSGVTPAEWQLFQEWRRLQQQQQPTGAAAAAAAAAGAANTRGGNDCAHHLNNPSNTDKLSLR
ncbi:hypothetical protein VOLCADRAFT_97244 [Volvox carteri f. nagariensis]|uniref:Uncharacterized protein n=1 Tax=Volvox carteri f. nagariensis TaxID=3068 RepID=D8UC86_VOLCA|nr:uncharacterized protein VOLCADRAFT_97244 [Volvox carteri f. nagariensis]EFJ42656.1 hypothetical protein VOLCADRAFT_97244 [Volvox carteri f. nagariensis]|eukprot:XP_002956307.1 hypothetical protein VOLCADRAFT_97244 [Volvox carteri f. nagariensis]